MEVASHVDELKNIIKTQEMTIQRLEMSAGHSTDAMTLAQVARASQLEQQLRDASDQLRIYKKKSEEAEAAKEHAKMLQNSVNQLQRLEGDAARLRVENEQLSRERTAWEGFLSGLPGFDSVDEVRRNVSEMQHQNLALLDNNGKLSIELNRVAKIVEERDAEVKQLSEKLVDAHGKADDALRSLDFSNMRLRESERRMKSLEEILQSYRMEDAMPMHNFDSAKQAQIRELERQVADKNQLIAKMENDADGMRANIKQLEKEIDRLMEERQTLQNRLGRGDYNPATTKVLHFSYTPDLMRQDQQNQTELENLRERMRSLEEELAVLKTAAPSASPTNALSSNSSLAEAQHKFEQISSELRNLRQENSVLKEQIKEKEYSNKRFTEVCMTRIKEFKDTCYQLFGWKIDFDDQSGRRYRLQSMFARSADEFLLFQYSKKQLMLYETEFSKSIDASISGYLAQHGSIPSFLSSLSLALFERARKK
jgi:mitotic spindle assembly checkpoint protein MAD1